MLNHDWKRWVAENKLLNIPDDEIISILERNGFTKRQAKDELLHLRESPYFQAANHYTQLLHKRHSLALIERKLAKLNPKYQTIERRSNVSREEFLEKYYSANRPVILTDQMHNWKAMTRWTPEYLKSVCGDTLVNIQTEREKNPLYETDDRKHRRSIKFADFIDMVAAADETNDYYMTARDAFFKNPAAAPLIDDVEFFPNYLQPKSSDLLLWYGPKGTYTPLHHDMVNIFMAQIKGRKRIRLMPSTEMDLLYNDQGVYTLINGEDPDYDKYPAFRHASITELELHPGEVLFLPVGWWHDVKALDQSITVSLTNFVFLNSFDWVHPKRIKAIEAPKTARREDSGLDASWLGWIDENVARGCDRDGMVDILLQNGFKLDAVRIAMGAEFPASYVIDGKLPDVDYKALFEIPVARLEWKAGFHNVDNPKLQLFTLEHFLTDEECDRIVELMQTNLRPSTVTVYIEGYRTSFTSDLSLLKNPLIEAVDRKISNAMGIGLSFSEGMQAQKYEVGQEFKPHTDYFHPNSNEYKVHAGGRGNRTWTFMIYLNNTPKGGGTRFVDIDKTIYPQKGMAVIWNSLYASGLPNPDTMHWGMPIEEGQKFIITKWFRERGKGDMFDISQTTHS